MTSPSKFTDRQNKMVLDAALPDRVLGERLGCTANQISQHRTRLRAALEKQHGN